MPVSESARLQLAEQFMGSWHPQVSHGMSHWWFVCIPMPCMSGCTYLYLSVWVSGCLTYLPKCRYLPHLPVCPIHPIHPSIYLSVLPFSISLSLFFLSLCLPMFCPSIFRLFLLFPFPPVASFPSFLFFLFPFSLLSILFSVSIPSLLSIPSLPHLSFTLLSFYHSVALCSYLHWVSVHLSICLITFCLIWRNQLLLLTLRTCQHCSSWSYPVMRLAVQQKYSTGPLKNTCTIRVALVWLVCDTFGMLVPLKLLRKMLHIFLLSAQQLHTDQAPSITSRNNWNVCNFYIQIPSAKSKVAFNLWFVKVDLNSSKFPFDWSDRSCLGNKNVCCQLLRETLFPSLPFYLAPLYSRILRA